ncbi:MAG TPA: B-box zinc finger protein [Candidatus Angelobacter sp.]|nr:B-box zinc finger protein [Candidatus Angelobacter sp.]
MNCAVHNQTEAVAFCRTCGKPLCEDCKRDVMGAIYCEPCIAARLQGQPPVGATMQPPAMAQPSAPNPVMAGILGFIPGVGAMYNGQFVKAFAHVVIFVLLILASSNISGMFGIGIGFFVIYMAFEAYKTAEARRLGLPAPDPLGLDKLFGIQETAHHGGHNAVPTATAAGGVPNPPPSAPVSSPLQVAPPPPPTQDTTPVGAIVLLALGFLFLLSNFGFLHVGRMWPLILIGFGLWIAYKRTAQGRVQ